MKSKNIKMLLPGVLALAVPLFAGCGQSSHAGAHLETRTLSNGVRAVVVQFPKSTNVSLFTFLLMGLASDEPKRAQWSHLVEHLVIRSTFPDDLTQANAETAPDNMRLDFYGNAGNWKEGLAHHRRWLEGVPFTEATLVAEKPKVIAECDFTAKNLATHKFALAAWAQAYRHGRTRIELKGDVQRASLKEVQEYRDSRLFVPRPGATTVCLVGGVDPEVFFAEAEQQLGHIKLDKRSGVAVDMVALSLRKQPGTTEIQPEPPEQVRTGNLELTWDLDARHLVLTWRIPIPMALFAEEDGATLMVAAQWLNMQFFSDPQLRQQTGQVLAGTDLVTPGGNFFYVSASLRPGASFAGVQKKIQAQVARLTAKDADLGQIRLIGQQLASSLTQVPDPDALQAQAPPGMSRAMIEGNAGLVLGLNLHRYGSEHEALAKRLSKVTASSARQAVAKYLIEEKRCAMAISTAPDGK